jgi:hypothetical protein
VLAGAFASTADSHPGTPVESPIPAAAVKDCEARILKEIPGVKFVGPFARYRYGNLWKSVQDARVLWIAAPTRAPGFMGQIVKHSMGCKYQITDGKPVFEQLIPEINLPRRALMPGEK